MTLRTTQPFLVYSPIGRTGSTALKAWIDASPDVGPNANEFCYLPGWLIGAFLGDGASGDDHDYFARKEPLLEFFRRGISAYQVSPDHAFGIKVHEVRALPLLMQIWPDAKVIHSVRDRQEQKRSKHEQRMAMYNAPLREVEFAKLAEIEDAEIARFDHLRVDYGDMPAPMADVFDYLGLRPGRPTADQLKGTYFARTHSDRNPSFDESGWLKR